MTDVKSERWYTDPFGWYEEQQHPELYGVQLTETVALDFLAGLYDIWYSFKSHDNTKAIREAEVLATLLIAGAKRVGGPVIEELLSSQFNSMDFDSEITKLIESDNCE